MKRFRRSALCKFCEGKGMIRFPKMHLCPVCQGEGIE